MDLIEKINDNNNRHPWELSRVECLIKEINKYHKGKTILDIGCGDSYFDRELLNPKKSIDKLYGIDVNLENEFTEDNYIVVNNYKKINDKKFDTILMFDVLEHIENDSEFLKDTVIPLLNKDGKIIITVPAYQKLFSEHDKKLKHYRRYNIKMLKKTCAKSGLSICTYHYFYCMLLPVRFLTKLIKKNNEVNDWKYSSNHILTRMVKKVLNLDYLFCKKLNRFSFGLSLFAVIEKR